MSNRISREEAEIIKERHSDELLNVPGVFSVGTERDLSGECVLKVLIDKDAPLPPLPEELDGLKVIAERRERIRKQ